MIDRSKRPAVTPFTDVHLDFPQSQTLSCGIPIWVINGGDEQVCRISVYVAGGTIHESQPLLSLLTPLMALEGSEHFDTRQIAERLDYYGAWKTALNHDTMSELSLSSISEHYGHVLPLLVDGLAHATFPESEFGMYRQRYAANYATMRERVKYLAGVEMRRLYYGDGHPLVADIDPAKLAQMSVSDLKAFYARFFHPSNCRLILSGKVTDEMVRLTDEAFSQWVDDKPAEAMPAWSIRPSDQMLKVVDKPGAVQAAVAMTLQAIGRTHPDYLSLRLLCTVLGGYFGSRLMSNIREEKGYTYGIHAFLSGRAEDGYIGVSTECDVRYTWQLIEETKHEMQRLIDEPIPEDELNLVRQFMLSDQAKTLDTPFNKASYVASTWLYGVYPEYYNQQIHTILHTTPEQLQQVAKRYLNLDKLRIVIAGDQSKL